MADRPNVRQALAQAGLAPIDARALLAHVLGRDYAWLAAHPEEILPQQEIEQYFSLASKRRDGQPIAYLVGRREFYGIDLAITPDVLIPRPETETLVDAALAHITQATSLRVLDLGTGSGAIALAIAQARPRAEVLGVDVAAAAVTVAQGNAARLQIGNARFAVSDWFAALGDARFDVIVANPPYIADDDPHLREGDLRFEPRAALTPGGDGLDALRRIVEGAPSRLAHDGRLLVEHGYDQADAVAALFTAQGFFEVRRHRDLAGHWRVAEGRLGRG
jgi:release factor glutamine methyltransferase